jgi:Flp pilus assembly protein TadG
MLLTLQKGRDSQRGASLMAFTLLLTFIILPITGLGIDVAIQYWIKARLSSAVDSAALAAGRSLSVGSTLATQIANAQAVGRQYFAANFPAGTLGTTVINGQQVSNSVSISVTTVNNYITVAATAQVNSPLYFLKILHLASGTITATSQSTRRNANIVLVLDRSGSMNTNGSCSALMGAVNVFTSQFIDGRDELGMITFSTTSNVDFQPSLTFQSSSPSLDATINTMVCEGATSTAQALTQAYKLIQTTNATSALNVILFFTDGGANTVVEQPFGLYSFPIKTQWDYRYGTYLTSQIDHVAPSSCSASDKLYGGYTDLSESLNPTGSTAGVFAVNSNVPITSGNDYPPPISAPGCLFASTSSNACGWGTYTIPCGRNDVAYIPSQDAWGNSTFGYKPAYTYTSGPYATRIRSDSPLAIRNAAINAADSISQQIRSDTTYDIVTYTIGLTGNEPIPMDTDFLERIANDPRASNYNSSQPQGMFMMATDSASLLDAFNAIASQIIRLSK